MTAFREWREAITSDLARSKRAGVGFDVAWDAATVRFPPRMMEQRTLAPRQPSLFADLDVEEEVSVVEFFRAACEEAWHGRRRELEDLPAALAGGLARDWPTVGGRHTARPFAHD